MERTLAAFRRASASCGSAQTRHAGTLALLFSVLAGCADSTTGPAPGEPARIIVQSGDRQSGLEGRDLPLLVTIQVVDEYDRGVPGVAVWFETMQGSGGVDPASVVTSEMGTAQAAWRLGPADVRSQRLAVYLSDQPDTRVMLEATALRPDETDVLIVHGALGPLRGVVLAQLDERLGIVRATAASDSIVPLQPISHPVDVIVFSTANRPFYQRFDWTAAVDTMEITLLPPVPVDMVFRVRAGDLDEQKAVIAGQLDIMLDIWAREGAGLVPGSITVVDAIASATPVNVVVDGLCLQTTPASTIEVAFVSTIGNGGYSGYGCTSGHVFMGLSAARFPNRLAHEVGHTFALSHSVGVMALTPGSTMTDGQIFKAHFDARSALNTIFGAQPESLRQTCIGPSHASPCLPDDFNLPPAAASATFRVRR